MLKWNANMNLESGQYTSKGEWGTLYTNPGSPTFYMDILDHSIKQLKHYLKTGASPRTATVQPRFFSG